MHSAGGGVRETIQGEGGSHQNELLPWVQHPTYPTSTVHSQGASRASLRPVVSGTPKPEVTWFLEGAPVRRREGMVEMYEEGGCHYLCLLRARPRDSGSYSCTASNVRGQVSCGWNLLVKREYKSLVTLGSL